MFELTRKYKHSTHGKDGKRKSFFLFFLNGVQILKQKAPFDETFEEGFNRMVSISDVYLLNGRLYQKRDSTRFNGRKQIGKIRDVSFPISKNKLTELGVPSDLKITMTT